MSVACHGSLLSSFCCGLPGATSWGRHRWSRVRCSTGPVRRPGARERLSDTRATSRTLCLGWPMPLLGRQNALLPPPASACCVASEDELLRVPQGALERRKASRAEKAHGRGCGCPPPSRPQRVKPTAQAHARATPAGARMEHRENIGVTPAVPSGDLQFAGKKWRSEV